jgi:hypothetical protein
VHAVVVTVTIIDFDRAVQMLNERIVPGVSQAPGFVAGYWTRSDENRGLAMIVLESEDAANGVAQMINAQAPDNDAVNLESVEIREVVAHA